MHRSQTEQILFRSKHHCWEKDPPLSLKTPLLGEGPIPFVQNPTVREGPTSFVQNPTVGRRPYPFRSNHTVGRRTQPLSLKTPLLGEGPTHFVQNPTVGRRPYPFVQTTLLGEGLPPFVENPTVGRRSYPFRSKPHCWEDPSLCSKPHCWEKYLPLSFKTPLLGEGPTPFVMFAMFLHRLVSGVFEENIKIFKFQIVC